MARLLRLGTLVVAAVAVAALLAPTAAATTDSGDSRENPKTTEPSDPPPDSDSGDDDDEGDGDGDGDGEGEGDGDGETIEDLPSVDGFVEQLPPAVLLKKLPDEPTRFTRTVGRGTDGHYCNSFYIKHVSYTFYYDDPDNANQYTRIHVQPTRRYRYFFSGLLFAGLAWDALANCISDGGPHGVYVRSWDAIEDQFLCHAAVGVAAGKSWDLEGHRAATNNPYTWATNGCNW